MKWLTMFFPSPIYGWALLGVFLLGAAGAGATAWTVRGWQTDAKLFAIQKEREHEKRAQAEAIAKNTNEARAIEQKQRSEITKLEVKVHENANRTNRLLAENRRLARLAGGLRDPSTRCPSVPGATEPAGTAADQATGAQLSDEATEFLLEFAAQCDRAADYAQTCHEYVMKGRP